jgi:hemolysin III
MDAESTLHEMDHRVEAAIEHVRPKLRGWLHAAMAPLALIAAIVLITLSRTPIAKVSAAVFGATSVLLFATSAVYHRGTWSPKVYGWLKRFDHSNIFLIIAGSYTPFALMLPADQARSLLLIVWTGAIAGVLFRVFWVGAPRWLYVPVYLLLGYVALFYFGPLLKSVGPTVMTWVVVGGVFYTIGAIVYGIKRPNPSPRWFGFHEVFHACTIVAFTAHYVAASLALYGSSA